MKRRELVKSLTVAGAVTILPGIGLQAKEEGKQFHIIGVGSGGTNAMVNIFRQGINAKYSCITGRHILHLGPKMQHIFFEPDLETRLRYYKTHEKILLTDRMKSLFDDDDLYVITVGLGASVGTGLIYDLLDFLQTKKKKYFTICSLPFCNEGSTRRNYAMSKKAEIEKMPNVHFIDFQTIRDTYGDMSISTYFAMADNIVYDFFEKNIRANI